MRRVDRTVKRGWRNPSCECELVALLFAGGRPRFVPHRMYAGRPLLTTGGGHGVCVTAEGEEVTQGETFGTIEAVKTVSDLFMPVTGEVLEVNAELEDAPESVNEDPYGQAWIIKIAIKDASELESLMSSEEYQQEIGA